MKTPVSTIRDLADLYGKAAIHPSFQITHPDRHLQVPMGYLRHKARVLFDLVDCAGDLPARSMTLDRIPAFMEYLHQVHDTTNRSTVLKMAATAHAVTAFGFEHANNQNRPTPPSDADIAKLIATARQQDPLIGLGLGLSRYAGLRTSEVLLLLRKQVYPDQEAIKVAGDIAKRKGVSRVIEMPPELIDLLRAAPHGNPDEPMIPLTMAQYRRRVEAVRIAAGVPPLHKDALRTSYSFHLAWAGHAMAKLRNSPGHSTGSTATKNYYK